MGDAGSKWAFFDRDLAAEPGIAVDEHGKMPDVVIYDRERDWLFLIEAVTSHGPVNAKGMGELKALLGKAKPGLVLVTAFPDRRTSLRYFGEIAWETEVWIAESPGHLVHFDGDRADGQTRSVSNTGRFRTQCLWNLGHLLTGPPRGGRVGRACAPPGVVRCRRLSISAGSG